MDFTRSEIQSEYQAAITAAENEYKTSVDAARRLLESKRKTARETMQTKIKALEQDLASTDCKNRTFQNKRWNVSWDKTGMRGGSMPVRLLWGH